MTHAFVRAHGNRAHGWVRLQFGFNKETSDLVKSLPGAKWGPFQGAPEPWTKNLVLHKSWFVPAHSWAVLEKLVPSSTRWDPDRQGVIPDVVLQRARDYQHAAIVEMIKWRAFFLLFDMRVGKTFTSLGAAMALVAGGHADAVLILYPAQVGLEWQNQTAQWAEVELQRLDGRTTDPERLAALAATPYLFLGCHYEILSEQETSIAAILDGKRVVVISDECQHLQNRKVARGKAAIRLSRGRPWLVKGDVAEESQFGNLQIVAWYPLSGTPMRNKPKNLWLPMELALPGSMGGDFQLSPRGEIQGYWAYGKRYCDAKEGEYGWLDKGVSNAEELHNRLASISIRKTRADVAGHLPPSERKIFLCEAPASAMESYAALEREHAPELRRIISRDGEVTGNAQLILESLARETSKIKIPKAIERVEFHMDRGVKIVAFGHFKETVRALAEAIRKHFGEGFPLFDAGTYQNLSPDDRKIVVESWTNHAGPAVLCANSLASGVGIDMSAAEVGLHIELEWVPADLLQRMARLEDVHKGTRKIAAVHEFFVLRDTIDEPMATILVDKIRALEAVVGKDPTAKGLGATLVDSGLVKTESLGLESTNKEAISAALAHLREKLLSGSSGKATKSAVAEVADLEEEEDND